MSEGTRSRTQKRSKPAPTPADDEDQIAHLNSTHSATLQKISERVKEWLEDLEALEHDSRLKTDLEMNRKRIAILKAQKELEDKREELKFKMKDLNTLDALVRSLRDLPDVMPTQGGITELSKTMSEYDAILSRSAKEKLWSMIHDLEEKIDEVRKYQGEDDVATRQRRKQQESKHDLPQGLQIRHLFRKYRSGRAARMEDYDLHQSNEEEMQRVFKLGSAMVEARQRWFDIRRALRIARNSATSKRIVVIEELIHTLEEQLTRDLPRKIQGVTNALQNASAALQSLQSESEKERQALAEEQARLRSTMQSLLQEERAFRSDNFWPQAGDEAYANKLGAFFPPSEYGWPQEQEMEGNTVSNCPPRNGTGTQKLLPGQRFVGSLMAPAPQSLQSRLLLLAPPGSGKTNCAGLAIARWILERDARPNVVTDPNDPYYLLVLVKEIAHVLSTSNDIVRFFKTFRADLNLPASLEARSVPQPSEITESMVVYVGSHRVLVHCYHNPMKVNSKYLSDLLTRRRDAVIGVASLEAATRDTIARATDFEQHRLVGLAGVSSSRDQIESLVLQPFRQRMVDHLTSGGIVFPGEHGLVVIDEIHGVFENEVPASDTERERRLWAFAWMLGLHLAITAKLKVLKMTATPFVDESNWMTWFRFANLMLPNMDPVQFVREYGWYRLSPDSVPVLPLWYAPFSLIENDEAQRLIDDMRKSEQAWIETLLPRDIATKEILPEPLRRFQSMHAGMVAYFTNENDPSRFPTTITSWAVAASTKSNEHSVLEWNASSGSNGRVVPASAEKSSMVGRDGSWETIPVFCKSSNEEQKLSVLRFLISRLEKEKHFVYVDEVVQLDRSSRENRTLRLASNLARSGTWLGGRRLQVLGFWHVRAMVYMLMVKKEPALLDEDPETVAHKLLTNKFAFTMRDNSTKELSVVQRLMDAGRADGFVMPFKILPRAAREAFFYIVLDDSRGEKFGNVESEAKDGRFAITSIWLQNTLVKKPDGNMVAIHDHILTIFSIVRLQQELEGEREPDTRALIEREIEATKKSLRLRLARKDSKADRTEEEKTAIRSSFGYYRSVAASSEQERIGDAYWEKLQFAMYNHAINAGGQIIPIIVGNRSISESINLYDTNNAFFFDLPNNMTVVRQAKGRIGRLCGFSDVSNTTRWYVRNFTLIGDAEEEAKFLELYHHLPAIQQLQDALKPAALDCPLFKEHNNGRTRRPYSCLGEDKVVQVVVDTDGDHQTLHIFNPNATNERARHLVFSSDPENPLPMAASSRLVSTDRTVPLMTLKWFPTTLAGYLEVEAKRLESEASKSTDRTWIQEDDQEMKDSDESVRGQSEEGQDSLLALQYILRHLQLQSPDYKWLQHRRVLDTKFQMLLPEHRNALLTLLQDMQEAQQRTKSELNADKIDTILRSWERLDERIQDYRTTKQRIQTKVEHAPQAGIVSSDQWKLLSHQHFTPDEAGAAVRRRTDDDEDDEDANMTMNDDDDNGLDDALFQESDEEDGALNEFDAKQAADVQKKQLEKDRERERRLEARDQRLAKADADRKQREAREAATAKERELQARLRASEQEEADLRREKRLAERRADKEATNVRLREKQARIDEERRQVSEAQELERQRVREEAELRARKETERQRLVAIQRDVKQKQKEEDIEFARQASHLMASRRQQEDDAEMRSDADSSVSSEESKEEQQRNEVELDSIVRDDDDDTMKDKSAVVTTPSTPVNVRPKQKQQAGKRARSQSPKRDATTAEEDGQSLIAPDAQTTPTSRSGKRARLDESQRENVPASIATNSESVVAMPMTANVRGMLEEMDAVRGLAYSSQMPQQLRDAVVDVDKVRGEAAKVLLTRVPSLQLQVVSVTNGSDALNRLREQLRADPELKLCGSEANDDMRGVGGLVTTKSAINFVLKDVLSPTPGVTRVLYWLQEYSEEKGTMTPVGFVAVEHRPDLDFKVHHKGTWLASKQAHILVIKAWCGFQSASSGRRQPLFPALAQLAVSDMRKSALINSDNFGPAILGTFVFVGQRDKDNGLVSELTQGVYSSLFQMHAVGTSLRLADQSDIKLDTAMRINAESLKPLEYVAVTRGLAPKGDGYLLHANWPQKFADEQEQGVLRAKSGITMTESMKEFLSMFWMFAPFKTVRTWAK